MTIFIIGGIIALTAIIADAIVKTKKAALKAGDPETLEALRLEVARLQEERRQFEERLRNLETIVTAPEWALGPAQRQDPSPTEMAKKLAEKLEKHG